MSIAINPYVSSSGELLMIVATLADNSARAYPTAVGGTLAVEVNGSPVTMGPATWTNTSFQCPFVSYLFPTAVLDTDVVTYTLTAGAITTASGNSPAVSSFTAVPNYVGQDEPGFGGSSGFTPNRVMPAGISLGSLNFLNTFSFSQSRNARLRLGTPSGSTIVFGETDPTLPLSWTPNGTIVFQFMDSTNTNGINSLGTPSPIGQYSIVFDDVNANNSNALKVWFTYGANGGVFGNTCVGQDLNSPGDGRTTSPYTGTYVRTVAENGTTVTVTYQLSYGINGVQTDPNPVYGYSFNLWLHLKSPTGHFYDNGTISNFWIFTPGDEANDRSDSLAPSGRS